jgi:hypothetical protein
MRFRKVSDKHFVAFDDVESTIASLFYFMRSAFPTRVALASVPSKNLRKCALHRMCALHRVRQCLDVVIGMERVKMHDASSSSIDIGIANILKLGC